MKLIGSSFIYCINFCAPSLVKIMEAVVLNKGVLNVYSLILLTLK